MSKIEIEHVQITPASTTAKGIYAGCSAYRGHKYDKGNCHGCSRQGDRDYAYCQSGHHSTNGKVRCNESESRKCIRQRSNHTGGRIVWISILPCQAILYMWQDM